jgi:hypothetical protein
VSSKVLRALRVLIAAVLVLGASALAASCQSLANIDDRELGKCGEFCDTVMANCKGDKQVYGERAKCMGVCKLWDVGDPTEPENTNTLSCRLREAKLAGNDTDENIVDHCRSAGPEGVDCGGGCESYCQLYQRACGEVQCGSNANCVAKCKALRNGPGFDLEDDYYGNSLQCRLIHLSNSTVGGQTHCTHAYLSTPLDKCNDLPHDEMGVGGAAAMPGDPDEFHVPRCDEFCRVNGVACDGANLMYENKAQCLAVCDTFDTGLIADKTPDTLGCRLYHSYNSLCDPNAHCPHTSPGGEGHCGTTAPDKCLAYCHLARAVCPTAYASAAPDGFDNDDATCAAECGTLVDAVFTDDQKAGTRYSVAYAATPNTVACRFLALSRAAEQGKDGSLCATLAGFGAAECAP